MAVGALVLDQIVVDIGPPLTGPGTLTAASVASPAAVLLAILFPARRAAAVDPMEALQAE